MIENQDTPREITSRLRLPPSFVSAAVEGHSSSNCNFRLFFLNFFFLNFFLNFSSKKNQPTKRINSQTSTTLSVHENIQIFFKKWRIDQIFFVFFFLCLLFSFSVYFEKGPRWASRSHTVRRNSMIWCDTGVDFISFLLLFLGEFRSFLFLLFFFLFNFRDHNIIPSVNVIINDWVSFLFLFFLLSCSFLLFFFFFFFFYYSLGHDCSCCPPCCCSCVLVPLWLSLCSCHCVNARCVFVTVVVLCHCVFVTVIMLTVIMPLCFCHCVFAHRVIVTVFLSLW